MNRQLRTPTNPATLGAALDEPSDLRAEYDKFCADLKRHFHPVEGEYHRVPSFEEYRLAVRENEHG